jgi:hypothetical protein
VPLPVPLAPAVTLIHESLLDAVHVQVLLVDTAIDPLPAGDSTLRVFGEIEYEHTSAACVTVNVWPAIVSVPDREPPTFGRTRYATRPSPVPDAPDVTVIHEALLVAVHAHVFVVLTSTEPVPPSTGTLSLLEESE